MRSALSCLNACRYVPKHAAPRDPLAPQTRSALAVGLAAAMLPLVAGTSLADDPASALASTSAHTAAARLRACVGVPTWSATTRTSLRSRSRRSIV